MLAMVAKSALIITLYSLASSARGSLAFSSARCRCLLGPTPAAIGFFGARRSLVGGARGAAMSSSSSVTTALLRGGSSSSGEPPHLHTRPLAPSSSSSSSPSLLQRLRLRVGYGKDLRERVVHAYFHGVDTRNVPQIEGCFRPEGAMIRDVCSLANRGRSYDEVGKLVTPEFLGERCREFLAAHPDCRVMFHYGPTCGRGRNNNWVYAHWYEEGSWSGKSAGIDPDGSPLDVQGQTRFLVDDDLRISEIVITRTFSRWEEGVLLRKDE